MLTDMIEQFATGTVLDDHEIVTVRLDDLVKLAYVLMQQSLQRFDLEFHPRQVVLKFS